MRRRFPLALAAVAAVLAFGASPALAATQGCHTAPPPPSAVNVYIDQVPTSGSCPKKTRPNHPSVPPTGVQPTQRPTHVVRPSGPVAPVNTKVTHPSQKPQGLSKRKTTPVLP